jgi:UDP-glucose 4-epimerase
MTNIALVTGAAGFIGRHVARHLASEGWKVMGIGHGEAPSPDSCVSYWQRSSVTKQALLELPDLPNLVVHCAGSGSVAASIADPDTDQKKTVESTRELLEYIYLKSPQASIVYPSSAAVYGVCEPRPISIDSALHPVSPYGKHKSDAEALIHTYGKRGLKVAIVRLFSVYGHGLKKQLLWDACQRISAGEYLFFGTGDETRDWLHVSDAASLLAIAAGKASVDCPIVNGGSGIATANKDLLLHISNAIGSSVEPKFNQQTRQGDPMHFLADITNAEAWGWKPNITLTEGVQDYVNWFNAEIRSPK